MTPPLRLQKNSWMAMRLRPLAGWPSSWNLEEGRLFDAVAGARTFEGLEEALGGLRKWAFGWNATWQEMNSRMDLVAAERIWRRATRRVGPEVAAVLSARLALPLAEDLASRVPPAENWGDLRLRATAIASRFGISTLRSNLAPHQTKVWLDQFEAGAERLMRSLGWPEQALGALHLGVDLTERLPGPVVGRYDWQSHSIQLRELSAFAHEWAHALDFARGDAVAPRPVLRRRSWSEIADGQWSTSHEFHQDFLGLRARDASSPVMAATEMAQAVSAAMSRLSVDVPRAEWAQRLERRREVFLQWSAEARAGRVRRAQAIWDRWRVAVGLVFADAHSAEERAWAKEWLRLMEHARTVMEGEWSTTGGWVAFSQGEPDAEASSPAELSARALEAVWAAQTPDNPLFPPALLADEYPVEESLARCAAWWRAGRDSWFEAWISQDPRALLND